MIKLFTTQSFWCSQEVELHVFSWTTIPLHLQWMVPHLSFIGCPTSGWLVIQEGPQTFMNRFIRFKQLDLWGFLHWVLYDYFITSKSLSSIFWLPNRGMLASRPASDLLLANFCQISTRQIWLWHTKWICWWKKRPRLERFYGESWHTCPQDLCLVDHRGFLPPPYFYFTPLKRKANIFSCAQQLPEKPQNFPKMKCCKILHSTISFP